MTPKKYSERKREEHASASSETLGVILILLASFLLLCVLTRSLILGDVGEAVFNILVGLFGYSAYPLLLLCLVFGIVKAKKSVIAFPRRYITATVVVSICVIFIAHLATSTFFVDGGYAGYLSAVYASKTTVGGLLAGLIVYPIYALLGFVVSYIFYALVIAGAILLSSSLISKGAEFLPKKKKNKKKKNANNDEFVASRSFDSNGDYPSTVPNGLFVGTIIPPAQAQSAEGSFDDLPESVSEPTADEQIEDIERNYEKERARKILFGDRKFSIDDYLPKTEDASEKPKQKIESENSATPDIALPAAKPFEHRFVEGVIINGDEVSAKIRSSIDPLRQGENQSADESSNDASENAQVEQTSPTQNAPTLAPTIPATTPVAYVNNSPIINGDYFTEEEEEVTISSQSTQVEEEIPTATSEPVSNENVDYTVEYATGDKEDVREEVEYRVEYAGPIEETVESVDETEYVSTDFEEDEPVVYDDITEEILPETVPDTVVGDEELVSYDDEVVEGQMSSDEDYGTFDEPISTSEETDLGRDFERTTTSFRIIDEVEDASEHGYSNDTDTTGYYSQVEVPVTTTTPVEFVPETSEEVQTPSYAEVKREEKIEPIAPVVDTKKTFDERVEEVSRKVDGTKNQIDMESFMRADAEKKTSGEKPKKVKKVKYVRPPMDLLTTQSESPERNEDQMHENIELLEASLDLLGVPAKVENVSIGPAITRYELLMPQGMSVSKIEGLSKDIGYNLASKGKIRIEAPIPGRRAVGVEVPNDHIYTVSLTEIIKSKEFKEAKSPLSFALGKDLSGNIVVANLEKMPHLLVAGGTGSGKSSGLNSLLISILYKSSPAEVKFILIDPKLVEFMPYSGIPHLMTPTAITDVNQAINAFKWAEKEMDQRYLKLQKTGVRNIQEYNQRPEILDGTEQKLPYIVIIVDEFASLMLSSKEHAKELDDIIANIAGKARAAGIHLVLATQRPSVNVITGTIKSNLNSRIAFAVASSTDSRIILDKTGAESLLGRGDMLFAPLDAPEETRIQGAYVSNDEIKNVVQFVKENNAGDVDEEFVSALTAKSNGGGGGDAGSIEEIDPDILKSVCRCLINNGTASGSLITRRFNVGWNRAAKIIEYIESLGFIGPQVGSKGREVIITKEKFEEYFGEKF